MFCSTIIPTIGRPTLSKAIYSVLEQKFSADDFEIIVVNDSGQLLPKAAWQQSDKVRIIHTNRRERSVARNAGAAIAKGRYLHFLDDDDWILPGAFENFWNLAQDNEAADWLYGGAQLVDIHNNQKFILHLGLSGNCFAQTMAGEWVPLQSSLIKTDVFFSIGGFNLLATPGEDSDLCRRVSLYGNFAYVPTIVAVILREGDSSTNYALALKASRREREKILDEADAFIRMRGSVNSGYWYGRIVRVYLVSAIWNLQHGHIFTTMGRLIPGLVNLALAGRYFFVPELWQAIIRSHISRIQKDD